MSNDIKENEEVIQLVEHNSSDDDKMDDIKEGSMITTQISADDIKTSRVSIGIQTNPIDIPTDIASPYMIVRNRNASKFVSTDTIEESELDVLLNDDDSKAWYNQDKKKLKDNNKCCKWCNKLDNCIPKCLCISVFSLIAVVWLYGCIFLVIRSSNVVRVANKFFKQSVETECNNFQLLGKNKCEYKCICDDPGPARRSPNETKNCQRCHNYDPQGICQICEGWIYEWTAQTFACGNTTLNSVSFNNIRANWECPHDYIDYTNSSTTEECWVIIPCSEEQFSLWDLSSPDAIAQTGVHLELVVGCVGLVLFVCTVICMCNTIYYKWKNNEAFFDVYQDE